MFLAEGMSERDMAVFYHKANITGSRGIRTQAVSAPPEQRSRPRHPCQGRVIGRSRVDSQIRHGRSAYSPARSICRSLKFVKRPVEGPLPVVVRAGRKPNQILRKRCLCAGRIPKRYRPALVFRRFAEVADAN